ncbi:HEAT repeat domain-containing protein [Nitrosarchaeum koreense]|uniref:PBS lyase HEAT domain protein repeat-containing protein n=1 Tax=Nitrosarchaeum koreense MY1 TaxID=1001994 RepID=F9CX48_9ARCH|nr:HEAT repeat domain-containing protein [Nitrosarchaeum koreense]EGP93850.1 PBS lyase HEAT domain protein repeat-containing protein [Nitrosarchaeum koreense MY1]
MPIEVFDEYNMRELPDDERFSICETTLKNEKDESKRWDAVWLIGELAENKDENDPMFNKVSDVIEWVLNNDDNGVVKHEACFQVAARNMRQKIPVLVNTALHNASILAKHEAIESLGLMRAFEAEPLIRKALNDPSHDVRETAEFVLKRFERLKNHNVVYKPSEIL